MHDLGYKLIELVVITMVSDSLLIANWNGYQDVHLVTGPSASKYILGAISVWDRLLRLGS